MTKSWLILTVAVAVVAGTFSLVAACECGKRSCCCKPACVCPCPPPQTCQQIVYEERQCTEYKTVFEDVREQKVVDVVKYVPEIEYRDMPTIVWETRPCAPPACAPACGNPCAPAACAPVCCEKVPVHCLRKVPVEVIRAVPAKETIESVRMVEKKIPYTFTCRVPHVVTVPCPCAPAACAPAQSGGAPDPLPP